MSQSETIDDLHDAVVRQETCSLATVRRVTAMLNQDPDNLDPPRGLRAIEQG